MTTTVLIAGDDTDAKALMSDLVHAGGLRAVEAGPFRCARGPKQGKLFAQSGC